MIKKMSIIQYRKLKNLTLDFSSKINVIAGGNGTCKSSLLHLISNSFQNVIGKHSKSTDPKCLGIIKAINSSVNPKIESLTRGDKKYNEPAKGIKGHLFTVTYADGVELPFRRHNSGKSNRYALKPWYASGHNDKLPAIPVIYLGLTRLYPFGEFQNDEKITKIKHGLPDPYQQELIKQYKELTRIDIFSMQPQNVGDIKFRTDFESKADGVDSNTISSGEDNIFIILTALFSLKYYYDSLPEDERINRTASILLIDEFDATLHPALQIRLLDLVRDFSSNYRIQIVATTHSLSLLEYALRQKDNVIYLKDNIEAIDVMDHPDIFKIKMDLKTQTRKDIYLDKEIPIFTEDAEARAFLEAIFNYWQKRDIHFKLIRSCFYLSESLFGCETLRQMFKDRKLASILRAICVLDGDNNKDIGNYIISLPGHASPENVIFEYAEKLYADNSDFWSLEEVDYAGYSRKLYADTFQKEYKSIDIRIQELKDNDESTHGKKRTMMKELWDNHHEFIDLVIKQWVNDPSNADAIRTFIQDLNCMFKKTALYHGINNKDWDISDEVNNE